jgi:hypothetical protein
MPKGIRVNRDGIARQIADRLMQGETISARAVSLEFEIGNGAAFLALDQAQKIHSQWLLSHFAKPPGGRNANA